MVELPVIMEESNRPGLFTFKTPLYVHCDIYTFILMQIFLLCCVVHCVWFMSRRTKQLFCMPRNNPKGGKGIKLACFKLKPCIKHILRITFFPSSHSFKSAGFHLFNCLHEVLTWS